MLSCIKRRIAGSLSCFVHMLQCDLLTIITNVQQNTEPCRQVTCSLAVGVQDEKDNLKLKVVISTAVCCWLAECSTVWLRFSEISLTVIIKCSTSLRVSDYAAWGADVDCPQPAPTCRGSAKKTLCHRHTPFPRPHWRKPSRWLSLVLLCLNVLKMVPWDNMSDCGSLIITLMEGPILTLQHTHFPVWQDPEVGLHISPRHHPLRCVCCCHPFCKG